MEHVVDEGEAGREFVSGIAVIRVGIVPRGRGDATQVHIILPHLAEYPPEHLTNILNYNPISFRTELVELADIVVNRHILPNPYLCKVLDHEVGCLQKAQRTLDEPGVWVQRTVLLDVFFALQEQVHFWNEVVLSQQGQ